MSDYRYPGTELEALAQAPNYYRWILHYFRPRLHGRVLEVGAGVGTFAEHMRAAAAAGTRIVLVEPAPNLGGRLRERFAGCEDVEIVHGTLDEAPIGEPLDAVVMVNVLEHIEDDRGILDEIHARLRPGGALLLFVPALPWLYGSLDRAFEHARRYSRAGLAGRLEAAGFATATLRFMNLPGILSWLVAGRLLRLSTIRPGAMQLYDRIVVPAARSVEDVVAPPLGQNLLAVALKKEASTS